MSNPTSTADEMIEGCYRLVSLTNGGDLHLEDQEWKYGKVQVRERKDTDNSPECRDQRWLIAKAPGGPTYLIINLYAGGILGTFAGDASSLKRGMKRLVHTRNLEDKRGDIKVRVGPVSAKVSGQQWHFERHADGSYEVVAEHGSRHLSCSGGHHHAHVKALEISPDSEPQRWRLEYQTSMYANRKFSSWMKHVPGDTKLNIVNIPGTHQTLALRTIKGLGTSVVSGFDNPRCHDRSPYEQLLDGMRMFDCRLDVWKSGSDSDCLFAAHGLADQGYCFSALLMSLKIFLQQNPSETVILGIRNERRKSGFQTAFLNDFSIFWEQHRDLVYSYPRPTASASNPNAIGDKVISDLSLDEVRGRMIILTDAFVDGVAGQEIYATRYKVFWRETMASGEQVNGFLHEEGIWNLRDFEEKRRRCEVNTEAAKADMDVSHVYSTSWNMSIFASYNPHDFARWASPHIERLYGGLGVDGKHRIGVVMFDFYDEFAASAVGNIIRSNKGCGQL